MTIPSRRGFLGSLGALAATAFVAPRAFSRGTPSVEDPRPLAWPIRLNRNENAYGPSDKVAELIRASAADSNRYAGTTASDLIEHLAAVHKVSRKHVVLGCGSTEILRAAAFAYLGGGKHLIQASPTFGALERYARAMDAPVTSVRLTPSFSHDLSAMQAQAGGSTALVYVCNPNNPTASLTPRRDLEDFIGKLPKSTVVVIDEAYHHYVPPSAMYASFLDRPVDDDRIIVTRTFSAIFGLAGLRLGYAVASPRACEQLRRFLTDENINCFAARVAMTALADVSFVQEALERTENGRQEFFNQAMARALKPIDSHANFVMMDTLHPADEVAEYFQQRKILIARSFPPMNTHIRVSLGTAEEMNEFWRAWDTLPYPKHSMHH